jgi:hypothetical protein
VVGVKLFPLLDGKVTTSVALRKHAARSSTKRTYSVPQSDFPDTRLMVRSLDRPAADTDQALKANPKSETQRFCH